MLDAEGERWRMQLMWGKKTRPHRVFYTDPPSPVPFLSATLQERRTRHSHPSFDTGSTTRRQLAEMQSRVMNGRPYVRTYLPAEISQARQREREDAEGAWGLVLKADDGLGHGVEGRKSRGEVVLKREGGGSGQGHAYRAYET